MIREAIVRREPAEESGRRPNRIALEISRLPRRLGYHLGPDWKPIKGESEKPNAEGIEGGSMDHDDALRMLGSIAAAFDRRDLDAIMAHFTEDAVFESPRGPEPGGSASRAVTRSARRSQRASRGCPNSATDDDHFVVGDRGASEWTLTGTTPAGRADRGPGLRPMDLPRRRDRREGLVLENQDD